MKNSTFSTFYLQKKLNITAYLLQNTSELLPFGQIMTNFKSFMVIFFKEDFMALTLLMLIFALSF